MYGRVYMIEEISVKKKNEVKSMEEKYTGQRNRRRQSEMTNKHHYNVEIYNGIINLILNELNQTIISLI